MLENPITQPQISSFKWLWCRVVYRVAESLNQPQVVRWPLPEGTRQQRNLAIEAIGPPPDRVASYDCHFRKGHESTSACYSVIYGPFIWASLLPSSRGAIALRLTQ